MSVFSDNEIEYLQSQRIGRLATVNVAGEPHVVPLRFHYNPELDMIELGGGGMGKSKKFRDAVSNGKVAVVVDDMGGPWKIRGIEVRGQAEIVREGGGDVFQGGDPEFIRLVATRVVSWGIDSEPMNPVSRKVGE